MKCYPIHAFVMAAVLMAAPPAMGQKADEELQKAISQAAGVKASLTEGGVVRIGWQRTDVAVEISGMALKPPAGLGSWAAFKPAGDGAMVMGDTVVFEDEITPALDAALPRPRFEDHCTA